MEKGYKKFIYAISFVSLFFIGLVLLFNLIFGQEFINIANILNNIATILAYFVVVINAFFFVRTKRSIVYMVLYIIAVLLISVCIFLPFVL